MDQKLVCRKCAGNHLTIKCGKTQENNKLEEINKSHEFNKYQDNRGHQDNRDYQDNRGFKKYDKSFTIKITKLPLDVTKKELEELLVDWGYVKNINVVIYETTSTAFINFSTLDEATYFVKAINRTTFDNNFIYVSLI